MPQARLAHASAAATATARDIVFMGSLLVFCGDDGTRADNAKVRRAVVFATMTRDILQPIEEVRAAARVVSLRSARARGRVGTKPRWAWERNARRSTINSCRGLRAPAPGPPSRRRARDRRQGRTSSRAAGA